MHIVSNVEGLLKEGMTNLDVLRATFPAGTLTGAPTFDPANDKIYRTPNFYKMPQGTKNL